MDREVSEKPVRSQHCKLWGRRLPCFVLCVRLLGSLLQLVNFFHNRHICPLDRAVERPLDGCQILCVLPASLL